MEIRQLFVRNLPGFVRPVWARIEASSLGYRLAKGTFWSLAGAIISRGMTLAASMIAARVMGKVGFGELGVIQSTLGMFAVFAGLGMGITTNKHVAELKKTHPLRAVKIIRMAAGMAWISGGVLAISMFVFAPWLADHTLSASHLSNVLRIGSLLLLLGAVNGAQNGALAGFEAFKAIARLNLYSGLISCPLVVAGVYWAGLVGVVWALVLTQAITCLLSYFTLKQEITRAGFPPISDGVWSEWPVLWRFSLPALLGSISTAPVSWFCTTWLVNRPEGYVQMGYLNAANQWFNALMFLPALAGQALLPMLSESMGQKNHAQSRKALSLSIRLNAGLSLPILLIGSLASPWIMGLYGPGFSKEWQTLAVSLLTASLLAIQTPVGHAITAGGRMWIGAVMNLGWGIAFMGFTILLVRWGATGVATARFLAYLCHGIWTFSYAILLLRSNAEKPQNS